MEITEIEILNYKSVKAPVGVRIFSENPTVLIGKNGSGKTNILEALASVFSENTAFYPKNPDKIPPCKIHISLSNSDFSELFPKHAEEYNAEKCRFVVANDELNLELPSFENGMYDRVSVALDKKHRPEIFLHEKSGDKISLNMTSAGRRWYFTYYFMKRTLEKGDVFIIDEPAAMLHPLAQRELCGELLQLQKQGIKVIYSTHSPYLIPEQWSSVHFVTMGEKGTEAFIDMPQKKVIEKIVGKDIFDVQKIYEDYLNIDKKILAAKCYNAVAKAFDNIDAAYSELTLSEYTLESWKKKRKKPKFENVLLICEKTVKDITELLNSD